MQWKRKERNRKFFNRLAELFAQGLSNDSMSISLNREFDENLTGKMVKEIIKKEAIMRRQLIKTDEEFADIHKEMLKTLVKKIQSNLDILELTRGILLTKLEEIREDIPEKKLMIFSKEINNTIKTQNDTVKTMSEILKRMETETQSIEINYVKSIQDTVKILNDLEDMGFVEIKPEFYKSELGKGMKVKKEI